MTIFSQIEQSHDVTPPATTKIAVIGAGISGLYNTWRILNETKGNEEIIIFEGSDRAGGRLDSDLIKFPDGQEVKEEEGGMRFLFEGMDELMSLFLELQLENQIVPFPMKSDGNNRLFFRGHGFSVNEASADDFSVWSELYNLEPSEQGLNPKLIIDTVFHRILDANPQFKTRPAVKGPEFWQAFRLDCQWDGTPLNEWSLWDLYSAMGYSNECITLLYRLLGFNGTFLSRMNAGVAYQLLEDFPAGVKFHTFEKGFSTLPNKLIEKIGEDRISFNSLVESIDKLEGEQGYSLTIAHRDPGGETRHCTVRAEKVLLCLPRLALEKLFVRSNAFQSLPEEQSKELWNTLQSTSDQALAKINLYYDRAWWGEEATGQPTVEFGPNFADLPTGSVYPFYAVSEEVAAGLMYGERVKHPDPEIKAKLQEIADSKYGSPAALTIYCDYLNINFWSTLQEIGPRFDSELQKTYNEKKPQTIFPASEAVVDRATEFFKKIFATNYVPRPAMTSARIWEGSVEFGIDASRQFGFGVHQWAIGADDRKVIAALIEPLPNLYTCGEAFSDYQGWVEGALRSANLVLKQGFGLEPISTVYEKASSISPSQAIQAAYDANSIKLIKRYVDPNFGDDTMLETDQFEDADSCIGVNLTFHDAKQGEGA